MGIKKSKLFASLGMSVVTVLSGINMTSAEQLYSLYDQVIDNEAAWIAEIQFDNGAIPMHRDSKNPAKIVPYFSNIASIGLLENPKYLSNVKRYMDWYFTHINKRDYNNLSGTIYDYQIKPNGEELSLNSYDSTDSYAATFISLLKKYYMMTNDKKYLLENKEQFELIGKAMVSPINPDGLTWAKPDYKVKYLMDNTEVLMGIKDAKWLYTNVYNDEAKNKFFTKCENDITSSIQKKLWNNKQNMYKSYINEFGLCLGLSWSKFYPDATAQLYPIWTGLLKPDDQRSKRLYDEFNIHHSGWTSLNTSDKFPWSVVAYCAAIMGDKDRVNTFLVSVKEKYIDEGHAWPWNAMDSGMAIMAAQKMKDSSLFRYKLLNDIYLASNNTSNK